MKCAQAGIGSSSMSSSEPRINPSWTLPTSSAFPVFPHDPRDYGAPAFTAGYVLPTVRTIGPRDRLNQLWQVSDNLSIRIGSHAIKAGMSIARRNWTFDEAVNPRGTFNFDGTVTAGGTTATRDHQFADFLLGLSTSAQVSIEPFATRMNNWWQSYYLQDDWKLHSKSHT